MINEPNLNVTVGQFVTSLITNCPIILNSHTQNPTPMIIEKYLKYGYEHGWLEDMDITGKDEPLSKKNAARITHEFLRLEMHEPDSEDISAAVKLRDLYDCRVCTKHIMQVVAKGIMEGYYITDTLYLFGLNDAITHEDMLKIITRILHPEFRIIANRC